MNQFLSLKNLECVNANAFALTFAFAPSHTSNASKVKRECKPPHTTAQTFVRTLTDTALNVNRFEQTLCGHRTTSLRMNRSGDAHNIKIKRNNFFEGFIGYRKCVLLMNILQVQKMRTTLWHKFFFYLFAFFAENVSLLIPQKNYFVNPFFVSCNGITTHNDNKLNW